jgi:hypothetical protein
MVTLIVTHEVKNFADWKKAFEADGANRANAGFSLVGLYTAIDNGNMVTLIFTCPSMEVVNAMMGNPDFQETMKNAGVISKPDVKLLNKV